MEIPNQRVDQIVTLPVKMAPALALSWNSGIMSFPVPTPVLTLDASDPTTIPARADDIETLFNLHYARLVRSLTVICGNSEEAADAVQDAFVKAHLRWRKISQYDDPVGWIRRVAINKVRDGHRSRVRRDRAVERLGAITTTEAAAPEISEIGDLLASLPKQQRAAATMFYLDQMSVAEIADVLELSEGAVKFHLHQARQKMRANVVAMEGGA